MVETHIGYVTSVKQSRAGQGKPSRFIAGHMAHLEVHRGKGLSNQNHFFQTPITKLSGKERVVDIGAARINGRGMYRKLE
jgi:hypothetical protein